MADSLAGFAVIGSISSLAPGAEKVFSYSYTVQPGDIGHSYVVNSAILTYSFGDGISGTQYFQNVLGKKKSINVLGSAQYSDENSWFIGE